MDYIKRQDFLSLLRSGLWEQPLHFSLWDNVDLDFVFKLADEQSVVGIVAAGLERVENQRVKKEQALPFMKRVLFMEERNAEMNRFIANLFIKLESKGIYALLVKGQGIAQCYERPQWRAAGDVDLLLDGENYEKAKAFLVPLASHVETENKDCLHLGMTIDSWVVELHGSLRSYRLGRVNACIDEAQRDSFQHLHFRVWMNGETAIKLPQVDNDIVFVFTHILHHFFAAGIGLRQICDWCRLLWTYRDEIDQGLLSERLDRVRLRSEWEVFSSLAVNYLGMKPYAIPLYRKSAVLDWKADRLMNHIIRTGNFGHNQDYGYIHKTPVLLRKIMTFCKITQNTLYRLLIFPIDASAFYMRDIISSLKALGRGE